ncbi:CopM family metallochaperone [Shinella pollutisoli]|uniref:DUF305 domain-containing protein n=1 Tax=Shinella pollutisoli TaxID=2250594 RepID=A0ABV7DDT0_9HYPH|nr:DUF305 domain-containing protein [Shinella pollutisoli]
MNRKTLLAALAALALAVPALAEDAHQGHGAAAGAESPSSTAFAEANARMHEGMAIDYTGDADVDFVRGMIAHHQGAIDMARVELEFGKDPALRKLAEEIIAAQEGEIRMMREWLEKNGR